MDLSPGMGEDNSGAENPGELGGRNMNDEDEMFSLATVHSRAQRPSQFDGQQLTGPAQKVR